MHKPEETVNAGTIGLKLGRFGPWHIACAAFILFLFLFLSVRASNEDRWSDWGFGDAQTMLSLRQWQETGWAANYFLFIPQGYAKAIRLLDQPDLRQHAHGTCPGSSPRVGPRLWYTHYPAGYLVPYAALFSLGIDGIFPMRLLSILFSLAALLLMYLLFARVTSPGVSFLAVLFYGLSRPFLGYADTLANQPLDDLLRFAFMLAVVLSTRAGSERHRRAWMASAWVMEFVLSLSSFDSVFFVFAWLIGWDFLERRGFRWRTYLLFGMAPLTAHGLQFLQNVWYLGLDDAFTDIRDTFLLKHGSDTGYNAGQGRLGVIVGNLLMLLTTLSGSLILLIPLIAAYLGHARFLRGPDDKDLPTPSLLAVLFLCGLAFVLILPNAAGMPYEARQMAPFMALLVSGVTWSFIKGLGQSLRTGAGDEPGTPPGRRLMVPYLLLSAVLMVIFWGVFFFSDRRPVYGITPEMTEMTFAKELKSIPTPHEPIFFSIGGFEMFWDPKYVPGYPQILPLLEYYAGSRAILCFDAEEGLAADLARLARRTPDTFSPVLITNDPNRLNGVVAALAREGVVRGEPKKVYFVMGRYVADLTDIMRWRGDAADRNP